MGKGVVTDTEARETLVITRKTCERLFDFSFRLAQRRKARGGRGLLTCVDKANKSRWRSFPPLAPRPVDRFRPPW